MSRLKIKEALNAYKDRTGKRMTQQQLGKLLFPDSSNESASITITRLATGKTKTVSIDVVNKICEITGVDPNFLFNK